ncbi:DUF4244 domain-containing protein [Gordonia sp. NPDC127522]|uniref:DUF4244 domain-containing protein n=1 Tax=Gordonia sp. NPDC127522 TaxID=3345390 RepID=UPI003644E266
MFRTHDATEAAAPHERRDAIGRLGAHMTRLMADEEGMSTAEYAIGTIAAAAFGAILYTVVTGDNIVSALTGIIGKALNTSVG